MLLQLGINLTDAITILKPLSFLVIGIVLYSIIIFNLYKFLAKRDVIDLNLTKHKESRFGFVKIFFGFFIYLFENILLAPIFTFIWFAFLMLLIIFLAKEGSVDTILMLSMALVAAIRVTAYYNENLSTDLAKTLPFVLLAVFITESSTLSISSFLETIKAVPAHLNILIYYFIFAVLLELVLDFSYRIFHASS